MSTVPLEDVVIGPVHLSMRLSVQSESNTVAASNLPADSKISALASLLQMTAEDGPDVVLDVIDITALRTAECSEDAVLSRIARRLTSDLQAYVVDSNEASSLEDFTEKYAQRREIIKEAVEDYKTLYHLIALQMGLVPSMQGYGLN